MNIKHLKNIREVAKKIPQKGLDMEQYEHSCGSPSCVIGYAFHELCKDKEQYKGYASDLYKCGEWSNDYLSLDTYSNNFQYQIWSYLFGKQNPNSVIFAVARINAVIREFDRSK